MEKAKLANYAEELAKKIKQYSDNNNKYMIKIYKKTFFFTIPLPFLQSVLKQKKWFTIIALTSPVIISRFFNSNSRI